MAKKKKAPRPQPETSPVDGGTEECMHGGPHTPIEEEFEGKIERFCSRCKDPMPLEAPAGKPKRGREKRKAAPTATAPAAAGEAGVAAAPQQKRSKKPIVGKLAIVKDPRFYRTTISRIRPDHKRVLGLDLGTNCGVAFCDIVPGVMIKQAALVLGQWDLSLGPYDSGPLRHIRLKQFLEVLQPDLIFFEEVKYDPPRALIDQRVLSFNAVIARVASAAEFLGGLKVSLTTWAEERGIPCQGVAITQIKRWLTGKGNSGKEDMITAANARFGITLDLEDYESSGADNIADAAGVCGMAVEAYSSGLAGPSPWDGAIAESLPPLDEGEVAEETSET